MAIDNFEDFAAELGSTLVNGGYERRDEHTWYGSLSQAKFNVQMPEDMFPPMDEDTFDIVQKMDIASFSKFYNSMNFMLSQKEAFEKAVSLIKQATCGNTLKMYSAQSSIYSGGKYGGGANLSICFIWEKFRAVIYIRVEDDVCIGINRLPT